MVPYALGQRQLLRKPYLERHSGVCGCKLHRQQSALLWCQSSRGSTTVASVHRVCLAVPAPAEHSGVLQSHAASCMQQLQQSQQHGQQPSPALEPPQHQHSQQCTTTEAADAKRKRRRSGLHCNFMPLTGMHASWLYACMHVRHSFQKLEHPKRARAHCL